LLFVHTLEEHLLDNHHKKVLGRCSWELGSWVAHKQERHMIAAGVGKRVVHKSGQGQHKTEEPGKKAAHKFEAENKIAEEPGKQVVRRLARELHTIVEARKTVEGLGTRVFHR
jgi:hypothetical protein